MSLPGDKQQELSISEQAAQWLCELGDESQDRRAEFLAWLRESPRHVEEFLLTTTVWRAFDEAGPRSAEQVAQMIGEALAEADCPNVISLASTSSPSMPTRARAARIRYFTAGIAAAGGVLALGWVLALQFWPRSGTHYTTSIGEQRAFSLPDSSVVHLNAQSRVEVRFSDHARELRLLEGEALFTVAADRLRPFRVNAGDSVIQALGTQFNVYRRAAVTSVAVVEGAVQIIPRSAADPVSPTSRLNAGEQANITPKGDVIRPSTSDISDALAWRDRRVVFRAERLEDIAAEFRRYSPRHIRVEGEIARNKRITASFSADDPESLVLFLSKERELAVKPDGEGFLVTSPSMRPER